MQKKYRIVTESGYRDCSTLRGAVRVARREAAKKQSVSILDRSRPVPVYVRHFTR